MEAENFCKHIFHVVCATVQIQSHYNVTFCNWHKQDSGKCSHYICTALCSVQRRSHYVTLATASVAPPCDNSPYRRNIIVQYMCKWMLPKHYGAMQVKIWVQLYALYALKLVEWISRQQVSINWSMTLIMNWASMNWFWTKPRHVWLCDTITTKILFNCELHLDYVVVWCLCVFVFVFLTKWDKSHPSRTKQFKRKTLRLIWAQI